MIDKLPKIDLHCHLDGSVRPETIIDIARKENIIIPSDDIEEIKRLVIAPPDCESLDEYLKVFELPCSVMQTKESLRRVAFELYEDAAKENVKYMEVRFAPLVHTAKGLTIEEVIGSVILGMKDAEKLYGIRGNIILGAMRFHSIDKAIELFEAGKKFLSKGVAAVDLCASELAGFSQEFKEPIALAKQYGYRITIHAGETGIGKNVLDAVEILEAERIGHGVYITDCKEAYDIVKKKGITLEICPTSNVQTKAVSSYKTHPFSDFYKDGIKVTLNTDNRTVSNIDMTHECGVLFNEFNMSEEDYKNIYLNSVEASFTDEATKQWLRSFI
ncbi:adenosine deaminase [Inconstantimicrobium mannanitabidum]|uniref:Adenosine deaminase n=1 Tax=Inconstantimicrobium mannanitabidum TaxID=1604901 RepID=A0ACB5RFN7_9CLOT|nr:adenosine deaminase [Clostridium sp. TW13]GKX67881.1 adenosine deaminase [Clostridium sp. TW13]